MQSKFEQVSGPVRGYFIAAYAAEATEPPHSYVAYFKVCTARPASYFDEAVILHKGSPHAVADDAGSALQVALREAAELVSEWPEAKELPACRQSRSLFFWEAADLGLL